MLMMVLVSLLHGLVLENAIKSLVTFNLVHITKYNTTVEIINPPIPYTALQKGTKVAGEAKSGAYNRCHAKPLIYAH